MSNYQRVDAPSVAEEIYRAAGCEAMPVDVDAVGRFVVALRELCAQHGMSVEAVCHTGTGSFPCSWYAPWVGTFGEQLADGTVPEKDAASLLHLAETFMDLHREHAQQSFNLQRVVRFRFPGMHVRTSRAAYEPADSAGNSAPDTKS